MCKLRDKSDGRKWKYFYRQLLVCSSTWTTYFAVGLVMGSSTVLVPQLRQEANSTDAVTPAQASQLRVAFVYGAIPWDFLLPIITSYIGRKLTATIINACGLIGHIMFYCASDVNLIIISEIFQGPSLSCCTNVLLIIIVEYSDPKWRGFFLTMKMATFYWAILVANTIGTFFHWKYIPLVGIIVSGYSLITVHFWPESPYWLASKGRFDNCTNSHKWLKGASENSEQELAELLNSYVQTRQSLGRQIVDIFKTLIKKEFYKPTLICILLFALNLFSGKLVCTVYALEMLKLVTNDTSMAYIGMLILDAFTVLSMYVCCVLAKLLKRRTLLMTASAICALHLFVIALYLYLDYISVISQNVYVSLAFISGYSVSIAGTIVLAPSIIGEILPINSKYLGICISCAYLKITLGILFQVSPFLFENIKMYGTFLFFGSCMSVFLILVYFYLPETKDKTLYEISNVLNDIKPAKETNKLLSNENSHIGIKGNNSKIIEN